MNYLMAKGYSKEQSAAIVGNFMQESGMKPTAYNSGEGAYGLAQWRFDRRTGLESFASSRGQSHADFYTQLDYFDHESRTTEVKAGNQIRSATTLNEALAGMKSYERYGHAGARAGYAQSLMDREYSGESPVDPTETTPDTPDGPNQPGNVANTSLEPFGCKGSGPVAGGFSDPSMSHPKGSYAGEPNTDKLIDYPRGKAEAMKKENNRIRQLPVGGSNHTFGEPPSPYNAKHPYNKVQKTESGHIIEYDDTPGAERINIQHRSGSYVEMDKNGAIVIKSPNNLTQLAKENMYMGTPGKMMMTSGSDMFIRMNGGGEIEILGDAKVMVGGSVNFMAAEDINFSAGRTINMKAFDGIRLESSERINLDAKADITFQSAQKIQSKSEGDHNIETEGKYQMKSTGDAYIDGKKLYWNSDKANPDIDSVEVSGLRDPKEFLKQRQAQAMTEMASQRPNIYDEEQNAQEAGVDDGLMPNSPEGGSTRNADGEIEPGTGKTSKLPLEVNDDGFGYIGKSDAPQHLLDGIRKASQQTGVQQDFLYGIAKMEHGEGVWQRDGAQTGWFQFVPSTYNERLKVDNSQLQNASAGRCNSIQE